MMPDTTKGSSPYYPPRARWYSRLLFPWFRIQRALHMEDMHLPGRISFGSFLLSIFVPGFAFEALGKRLYGLGIFGGYCAAILIFLVALGHAIGNVAFGLMVGGHAVSVFYLIVRWLEDRSMQSRFITAFLSFLSVGLAIYLPLIFYLQHHWFLPLRVDGQVVVIFPGGAPESLQRGDLAAFRIPPDAGDHRFTHAGYAFGPVLGLGNETVASISIPENHWLVQAEFDMYYTHGGSRGVMQQLTVVSREQFVGRPFKHWFFRKQKVRNS